ncbi:MAG: PD40 domain-containing protein [Chloroflexi bacterium]|nr:PD40 domain-containing protein [Chloroflexota bacterium]
MNADGSGQQELIYAPENGQVYFPEWSPDGTRIAFTEVDFVEEGTNFSLADIMTVVIVDIEGKEILRVPRAIMPHWSPDGQALAVGAEPGIEGLIILMTPSIVQVETGELRHAVPRLRTLDSPRWSPDGNLLVYATDDGLHVIGLTEGSAPRRVVEAEAYSLFYLTPVWSADGVVLAFESDRRSGDPPGGVDSYVMVDVDRGIISRVGDSYPTKCGRASFFRDYEAHWIPGTSFAAWGITCTNEQTQPGIWIKDMTGGEERFLDTSSVAKAVGLLDVSTDGRRIAFSSGTGGLGYTRQAQPAPGGIVNIYVVSIEGGEPELLVEDARFPIWQPGP